MLSNKVVYGFIRREETFILFFEEKCATTRNT